MHKNYNRDEYVEIIWENIEPGDEDQFELLTEEQDTSFGEPYDYESLMHYRRDEFSVNGGDTIIPLVSLV